MIDKEEKVATGGDGHINKFSRESMTYSLK
jgi:hypothetical protein